MNLGSRVPPSTTRVVLVRLRRTGDPSGRFRDEGSRSVYPPTTTSLIRDLISGFKLKKGYTTSLSVVTRAQNGEVRGTLMSASTPVEHGVLTGRPEKRKTGLLHCGPTFDHVCTRGNQRVKTPAVRRVCWNTTVGDKRTGSTKDPS